MYTCTCMYVTSMGYNVWTMCMSMVNISCCVNRSPDTLGALTIWGPCTLWGLQVLWLTALILCALYVVARISVLVHVHLSWCSVCMLFCFALYLFSMSAFAHNTCAIPYAPRLSTCMYSVYTCGCTHVQYMHRQQVHACKCTYRALNRGGGGGGGGGGGCLPSKVGAYQVKPGCDPVPAQYALQLYEQLVRVAAVGQPQLLLHCSSVNINHPLLFLDNSFGSPLLIMHENSPQSCVRLSGFI